MPEDPEATAVGGFPSSPNTAVKPVMPSIPGYRIERFLGCGGMGEVWLARHEALDRQVAIKVLRDEFARNAEYAERFLREARAAAKVSHPRVVTVHDAGQAGNILFLAMEYMPGGDAHDRIASGPMSEAEAIRFLQAAAEGLQAIHDAGLLHRDLKPENMFIDSQGLPKIGDLGLARMAMGSDRMTVTGSVVGTPAYMSPEQAQAVADIDARSDIYSLAATGFSLLTGRPPFVGSSPWSTVAQVLNDPAPDPRQMQPSLSAPVAEAICAALAKEPGQRPASALAFARSLTTRMLPSAPTYKPIPAPSESPRPRPWWLRRMGLTVIGVCLGVILGGIAIAVWGGGDASTQRPGPGTTVAKAPKDAKSSDENSKQIENKPPPSTGVGGIFRDMKANVRRTLRHMMEGDVLDVHADVLRAVKKHNVKITKDEKNPKEAIMEGNLPGGDEMRVITRLYDTSNVEVSIQIGAIGDEARQRQVLEWIRAER